MIRERAALAGKRFLPEILFLLLVAAVFADPLFCRRNFSGRDLLPYHLPTEKQIHDAYAQGGLPLWSPDVSGGRPLLPNPNTGVLYPVRPLISALSFPLAFRIYPVLHWAGAGLGMMFLLRALGRGPAGSWVGAVTYAFCGVSLSEVFYTNIQPGMALVPWIVWAAARPVGGSFARRALPLAILFTLDILAGDPFTIAIGGAACALWILLEVERGGRLREAAALAAGFVLAALAAAPQIVASALWAPLTNRAVTGLPLGVATTFSIPPLRLLELLVPYPFGSTSSLDAVNFWARPVLRTFFSTLFCGGLAILAIPALFRRPSREETGRFLIPGARVALVLLCGAIVVSVLPWFLPAAWAEWRSPIPLRYPEKFAVAIAFALALASGLAADAWRNGARLPRGRIAVAVALAAAAIAARLAPRAVGGIAAAGLGAASAGAIDFGEAGRELAVAFAEAGLLWVATIVALDLLPRRARGALPIALLLIAAVPIAANRRIAKSFPEEQLFNPSSFARLVSRRDPWRRFRTLDASRYRPPSALAQIAPFADPAGNAYYRRTWFLYTPVLWNRGTVLNADPDVADLSRMESLRKLSAVFPALPNAGALFTSLSLRQAIRYSDQEPLPGYAPIGANALQAFDDAADALPDIRVAARLREAAGPVEALSAVRGIEQGEIVVETGRSAPAAAGAGAIAEIHDHGSKLDFVVTVSRPSWVFVLRGFWPFRTILVDRTRVEAVPAQLAFSAIPVPAGRHRVEWQEELPGGAVSWWGPVVALAAALFLRRRERFSRTGAAAPVRGPA